MATLPTTLPPIINIGRFSDAGLQSAIDHALDGVAADHGQATFTLGITGSGGAKAAVIFAKRLGNDWSVEAAGEVSFVGGQLHPEGELIFRGSF